MFLPAGWGWPQGTLCFWQIVDGAGLFALNHDENLTLRSQRPDVGAAVIFLLGQSPVTRGASGRIAADAGRVVKRSLCEARITAGADGIRGFFDAAHVGKNDSKDADVQHLLGNPLIHLAAVGRDSHHRRYLGSEGSARDDLAPVEHVLE